MFHSSRKTSVLLSGSPVLRITVMLGLCVCAALLGFRMGGPSKAAQTPMVAALNLPVTSVKSNPVRSGPAGHDDAPPSASSTVITGSIMTSSASTPRSEAVTAVQANTAAAPVARMASRSRHSPRTPPRVLVPMVFRDVDPAALGLSTAQWQEMDRMRERFTEKVGQQDPANPAYRQRWAQAQPDSDEQLRAFLGWDKFNQYQIAAAQAR